MFTNGNNDFYYDEFEVKASPCQTTWAVNNNTPLETNSANVYDEAFDLSFGLKYIPLFIL